MSTKRQDYISWDEYFMGVAMLSGMRSKDPNTQVGACIVSDKHKILSMGYNGFPTGCSDDDFPWVREGDDNKYASTPGVIASKKMLRAAGVTLRHYEHTNREVKLSL